MRPHQHGSPRLGTVTSPRRAYTLEQMHTKVLKNDYGDSPLPGNRAHLPPKRVRVASGPDDRIGARQTRRDEQDARREG